MSVVSTRPVLGSPQEDTTNENTILHWFCKSNRFLRCWQCRFLNETHGSTSIQMNTSRRGSISLKQSIVCLPSTGIGTAPQGDVNRNARRCGRNVNLQIAAKTWYRRRHHLTVQSCQGTKVGASPARRSPHRQKGARRKRRADAALRVATRGIWSLNACWSKLSLFASLQKS